MAPIRRYLRISKFSVLECRIYLDNPSDTRWLLDPRDPVLPRVFACIRPLVLPKLREENERAMARKKSKPVKDVIAGGLDDFQVSLFLRESRTRHSLLTRHKTFGKHSAPAGHEKIIDNPAADTAGIMVESDSESNDISLRDVPEVEADEETTLEKKKKNNNNNASGATDDKKEAVRTEYESFNIHGWVLCLLVTRKGERAKTSAIPASQSARQVLMEEWISTQAQADLDDE
ncbi:hypothetical protein ASPZODRAFT_1863516 [Penicilliopsis zonata CBS 506.65]|uniref:Uncharacterized protein n=1 Tax=Penicilliopsis zonata CBS 506.65 TaxID=1073090 RepID=A0A1L9SIQ3_9EURO|nr:hypothetical protein ASPZODRAFT_1863516 [Penicilliopsis zonata CBS 506.65]OJJ46963.1 hypothetical protein ASPZODRAFT_1863516 [Penicilliopsis zonata CBS 506.65]